MLIQRGSKAGGKKKEFGRIVQRDGHKNAYGGANMSKYNFVSAWVRKCMFVRVCVYVKG